MKESDDSKVLRFLLSETKIDKYMFENYRLYVLELFLCDSDSIENLSMFNCKIQGYTATRALLCLKLYASEQLWKFRLEFNSKNRIKFSETFAHVSKVVFSLIYQERICRIVLLEYSVMDKWTSIHQHLNIIYFFFAFSERVKHCVDGIKKCDSKNVRRTLRKILDMCNTFNHFVDLILHVQAADIQNVGSKIYVCI